MTPFGPDLRPGLRGAAAAGASAVSAWNSAAIARWSRLRSPSGNPSSTRSDSVRSAMTSRSRRCCAKRSE
ncbi:hypothetical protein NK6_6079 [Bradyrhizobium diazoefficiens]|uniref:Uncharacterized protein n=1 Tax=Bradyrhizobium diazoefficiens TaxID=1355477 RepID=A0A0E4BRW4_9BRAD|nr:hypothetical protein NK6_6079 [Bradyrhizobium diazoefficiens]